MNEFFERKRINPRSHGFYYDLKNEDFRDSLGIGVGIYSIFRYLYDDRLEFDEKMTQLVEELCGKNLRRIDDL